MTQGTSEPGSRPSRTGPDSSSRAGACSKIMCALVPLIPNEDTPAYRGRPSSGQGTAAVSSNTDPAQSTCGVGSSLCKDLGSTPWRIAMTILITPATPAAAWLWPILDL